MINIFSVKEDDDYVPQGDLGFSDLPLPARIKVIGVGGGGSNAVNRMIESKLSGVEFIAVNTDVQDLFKKSRATIKIQIGRNLTGGRGAGGKPSIGESAAKEDQEELRNIVGDADMIFVTAGMGGGTGTGAAPVIAKIAKDLGVLTVGVVTRPFEFEAAVKRRLADEGIKKMREAVDTLVIIPNEQIFKMADRNTSVPKAYSMADDVLRQGVQGITDLITNTGFVNTDFADVEATMRGQGDALMGIGMSSGADRAKEAAEYAIDNPLLEDTSVEGATRLLINISGSEDISMVEVKEIMNIIKAKADPDVETIHGIIIDPELGDSIKVTVVATGFRDRVSVAPGKADSPSPRKAEMSDIISAERFNEMRGLGKGGRTASDSYVGLVRHRNFPEENLEVPTYLRKHNPESESVASGKEA